MAPCASDNNSCVILGYARALLSSDAKRCSHYRVLALLSEYHVLPMGLRWAFLNPPCKWSSEGFPFPKRTKAGGWWCWLLRYLLSYCCTWKHMHNVRKFPFWFIAFGLEELGWGLARWPPGQSAFQQTWHPEFQSKIVQGENRLLQFVLWPLQAHHDKHMHIHTQ